MKLFFCAHAWPPYQNSGGEWSIHEVAKAMQDRGHEVTVMTKVQKPTTFQGVPLEPWLVESGRKAIRWADVVLTQLAWSQEVSMEANRVHKPVVNFVHGTNGAHIYKVTGRFTNLAVYNSEYLLGQSPTDADTMIMHPPVDWRHYEVKSSREFITLINSSPHKGVHTLGVIARRFTDKEFLSVRGGYGQQVDLQLPNVRMLDNTSDIREVYARTRVLLMPSEHETWGRTAIEAAASGIPTIASDLPGLRESLGDAGLFAEPKRYTDWYKHLHTLDDGEEYEKRSRLAKLRAKELDPRKDFDRLEVALENLAYGGRNAKG